MISPGGEPAHARRSLAAIVRANVLTRFNAILGVLVVVILAVGPVQGAVFGLVMVLLSSAIGIVQEGRAKRTLDRLSLRRASEATVVRGGRRHRVAVDDVLPDDVVELTPGSQVVADGEVVEADALEVDESLLTGESVPEAAGPGDQVLSGSFVTAGRGWYRTLRVGADAYANELAARARRFTRVSSDLRHATDVILRLVTWLIVPTAALLIASRWQVDHESLPDAARGTVAWVVSMVPMGLVLLAAVAPAASVIRLGRRDVLVRELAAVEGLARVDVVCIDKTGTITEPVLDLVALDPVVARPVVRPGSAADGPEPASTGVSRDHAAQVVGALAWADPEPNASLAAIAARCPSPGWATSWWAAFSPARRFSGAGFEGRGDWILGAPDVLLAAVDRAGDPGAARAADAAAALVDEHTRKGRRVLLLARVRGRPGQSAPHSRPAAVVALEERIRGDVADALDHLAMQGVALRVLSGDDPRTVAAVAGRVGIAAGGPPRDARELPGADDGADPADGAEQDPAALEELADALESSAVFGRVAPRQKQAMVRALQSRGHAVAMIGDGVNDVPGLEQADLGVALGSGSPASRAAAPVVLLDSSFASLRPVLAEGRRVMANVERVANLSLTKTVCATLLALAVGVAQLPFPFLPRHLAIIGLMFGAPALVLALAPNDQPHRQTTTGPGGAASRRHGTGQRSRSGFVGRVLRFAVPAGAVAATATMAAYLLARDTAGVDETEARTGATVTLLLVGLWILTILARPAAAWRTGPVAAMGVVLVVVLAVPGLRQVFDLALPSRLVVLASLGIAAMGGVALELGWQASGWLQPHARRAAAPPGPPAGHWLNRSRWWSRRRA